METITIVWLVVAVVLIFIFVSIYNGIISRFNAVQRAWADVLTQERAKNKTLPHLENLLEKYNAHEGGILSKITALREGLRGLNNEDIDPKKLASIEAQTREVMKSIAIQVENYPELKAAEVFTNLMNEVSNQQDNIAAAVRAFNYTVENHNSGIEMFPNNMVNSLLAKKSRCDVFNDLEASEGFDYKPNF